MKQTILMLGFCTALYACTNSSNSSNGQDSLAAADHATSARQSEVDTSVNNIGTDRAAGSSAKGAQLISASDCLSCHAPNETLVGPSYKEIAEKYKATDANANYLAGKIIEGGIGVWGEIPMSPHPSISKSDAIEMANYILSLK